ncbi:MAG TPA: hypothetical protein ENJ02_03900 [Chloroflexi bacterium]|nr:hypothetical protein [Chloroflexota bacterium]
MTFWIFLGALSASIFAYELGAGIQAAFSSFGRTGRLDDFVTDDSTGRDLMPRRSSLEAILITLLPERFDARKAGNRANVIDLLRRSGYLYDTPGDFYSASIRIFIRYLIIGGAFAAAMSVLDMGFAAAPMAGVFIFLGLRKPYTQLKVAAKKRAEAMRNNMLIGLSVLQSLLDSGVGVQDALRRTANVGGPFCNLLGLLVARMGIDDFDKALSTVRAHVPDPDDVELNLFLTDLEGYFKLSRPISESVRALRDAVHRQVVEDTEARAALVRQRSGLFGVLAVLGLVLSIIAPFMAAF